ncbi:hypothetical protein BH23BAC1_BH23BAC1_48660 [soil metagenome]|jgi:hypothetical protein
MKKPLILLLAVFTFSLVACDEEPPNPTKKTAVEPKLITITSFSPESVKSGAEIAIYGENFGKTISENYVTFDGWDAEVLQVPYEGMVLVRVPSLAAGDYTVSVNANGLTGTSSKALKVIDPKF